jgi:beta-fructofuranosidase
VLGPTPGSWDDLAVWSGSVARGDDGVWRMYYTAINTRGHELQDQQIGLAESDDMYRWHKVGDAPIVSVDPRLYRTLDGDSAASETWRDPFVYRDPDGDWRMLISGSPWSPQRIRRSTAGARWICVVGRRCRQ